GLRDRCVEIFVCIVEPRRALIVEFRQRAHLEFFRRLIVYGAAGVRDIPARPRGRASPTREGLASSPGGDSIHAPLTRSFGLADRKRTGRRECSESSRRGTGKFQTSSSGCSGDDLPDLFQAAVTIFHGSASGGCRRWCRLRG